MNLDFFNLKSIFLENTVVRNPRVGSKNRPTSRTIDVGCTGINVTDDIYTGETGINSEYLIQGSVNGTVIKGSSGVFTLNSNKIENIQNIYGLLPGETVNWGDTLRADGHDEFYPVTGISDDLTTLWLQDSNTTVTGINNFEVRKIKLDSTHFEYIKNDEGDTKFFYDKNNRDWRYTGIQGFTGSLIAESAKDAFIEGDPVTLQFYPSYTSTAPDVTSIDTTSTDPKAVYGQKVLENKLVSDTSDLILNPIPYPDDDQNFRLYWGPPGNVSLKTKDIDYTINYTMDPDYTSVKLPYSQRTVAYLKFLNELTDTVQVDSIGLDFQGVFNIHEDPSTSATKLARGITNIFPNSKALTIAGDTQEYTGEIIRVGQKVLGKYFDYNLEYNNGIINFIIHSNLELDVPNVLYNQNLIWDGVSVVKGVGLTGLKTNDPENLVIPYGIAGLTGINVDVYFEDIDDNDFIEGTDYTFEYQSGAIKLNKSLKSGECALVSYFVEGEDVVDEVLNLKTLRTQQNPIIESSITIKKTYSDSSSSSTGIKILIEGVDYKVFYLSGTIVFLNQSVTENLSSLQISYTPFSQVQCILQPIASDPNNYLITIVDDKLKVSDPFNLKFSVTNPIISTPQVDPFGENPTTYANSIIPGSLLSIKGEGEPGYGLNNLTPEDMIAIGITGLHYMGLDVKLGQTPDEFYAIGLTGIIELGLAPDMKEIYNVTNYTYDDVSKVLALDPSQNVGKPRPDLNDFILATYSYVGDVLPYAPVQTIFPVFNQDDNSILIEGFDKTDTIYPGMILRIDNFDPQKYYYFKVSDVEYDGMNTTITLASSFPEDIRNPSFYIFDDILNWYPLPSGTSVDSTVTVGADTLTLSGDPLEARDLLRPQTLMCVGGTDIYEILSTSIIDNNTLQVKIFPNLQTEYPSGIMISDPVYQQGTTDVVPKYPIITDPPHPALTLRYVAPVNAIYGMATIYIDGEKIVLVETVDNATATYNFYFKDYAGMRDLADAIINTVSSLSSIHNPFTLMSEDETIEQYYLGSGFWSSNLVLPFAQDLPVIIPDEGYLITIKQEVFRYILVQAYNDTPNFLVKQKDVRYYFSPGNLLAFISKSSGNLSFFEVSGISLTPEAAPNQTLIDTQVSLKDAFRENMIAPYIYKYDSINWIEVISPFFNIDTVYSQISFSSDLPLFKQNSFIRINDGLVYKIQNISVYDTITTLTLSPALSSTINKITSLKVSDMPVYLNSISPQPSIFINYTIYPGYSGEASVTIDDKNIAITEKLDGFSENTAQISLSHYNNLNQLASALNRLQLTIPGYNPLSVDTSAYKDVFSAGGGSLLLVPTTQPVSLPTNISVSKKIFEIDYTSPDSSTDFKITIPSDGSNTISLSEWKRSDKPGTLKVNTVSYSNKTIVEVINSISNLSSIIPGYNPWSVSNANYDGYFAANKPGYYTIIPFPGSDKDSIPYSVQTIENPQFWYHVGILNRNVLVEGTDYTIDGTQVSLKNPIQVSERYEVSYLGINDLSEYEGESITCSCRYFYSIPAGYQVNVYMDYLNPDQYYIQKLTERKFLEIVTQPQIQDILQQAGNSVGMGNDSGSDNSANNWDGGLVDLYYYLKDEKIKSQIYIKLFQWYKHRLRDFAAEAQLIMGIKYGHCNFYGIKEDRTYTLEDSYVEDNNYTLTKLSDLAQINNGFSKFFPVGYDGNAPDPYARFENVYQSYNEVFCYNIQYIDESSKVINTEGRVISTNPYWSNVVDKQTTFSNLDFDILPYDQESALVSLGVTGLYNIPYNQEDKHLRVTDSNFKFLNRISVGDQIQILDSQDTYNIGSIESNVSAQPVIITYGFTGPNNSVIPLTYDGTRDAPGNLPVYGQYLQNYSYVLSTDTTTTNPFNYPLDTPVLRDSNGVITGLGYRIINPSSTYDILVLGSGEYFTDSGIRTFVVQRSITNNVTTWKYVINRPVNWTLQDLEDNLPKDGLNIIVTRNNNNDFPVLFPAWDDEFNLGTKVVGLRIINQKTNTDIIKKPFSFADLFGYDDEDKFFTVYEGTYDELTGLYKVLNTVNVNLKYLTFFEERRVSQVLDAIKYNLTGTKYPLPFPPYVLKLSNIYKKKDNLGTDKFFYVDFDKYYDATANNGYNESIIFRSRNRNSWVQYAVDEDNDFVDPEYGFSDADVYKNFYDPNNLYLKLIIERQSWLTELNILKDIFDTNDKIERAYTFSNGVLTAQAEFLDYLNQISCGEHTPTLESPFGDDRPSCIKFRIESYAEILNFLLDQSDTTHQYLVDNTSGPLYRTMMEDTNISQPMEDSYTQAQAAFTEYASFQNECNFYYNLNNFYYNKWQTEYAKWVLSLEQGTIYQKDAKQDYQTSLDNYIDFGFNTFPAVKMSVIDQGTKPAFTVSGAKYVVTYNMLATSSTDQDEYDDATLIIQYKISDVKDIQQISFYLKSYPTLQNLVDGINSTCVHPVSNAPIISAANVFDYYPYRNYSTKWILRTYRATPNNDSNGPDTVGGDGWTVLSTDPNVDDRIYVCNVLDHRNYDSRVYFMSRTDIHTDTLTINGENIIAFPYYVDTQGNDILSKMGPIPVAGRWATDDASSTDTVDYTTEFNVLNIQPGVDNATIIDYEFLDYVQGEEQIPGEQTSRNPTYETSLDTLISLGYNPQTLTLSEPEPPAQVETGTEIVLDSNLQALNTIVSNVSTTQPTSMIIRDLRIILRINNQVNPDKYQDVPFVFSLRQYPTINDLNNALNTNHYASDANGIIILDDNGNAAIALMGEGAIYFNSTLIGSEDLQGRMKTVDIATQYTQQLIHVATYNYWQTYPVDQYDDTNDNYVTITNPVMVTEPIDKYYIVGWQLREQGVINGKQIIFRIDPRTYSPSYNYRFKIYDPRVARKTIFLNEKKDILAFDLYGWDDNAQYKIQNNVLYLRSATITNPVQIPLYKTSNLDTSIDHPEETLKVIDVIRLINNNATCNNYFFANLRFGREYNADYDYTYFPDTQIWAGGDGWVSIQDTTSSPPSINKVALDYLYLDKDVAFSLASVGANATYQIVPLTTFPISDDIVYNSQTLILSADVNAFEIDLNATDFISPSASYTVVPGVSLTLQGNYITNTNLSSDFAISPFTTMQDLVNAINLNPAFTASIYSAGVATMPSSNLVNGTNLSIATPTRLVASPDNIPVINISVNAPGYTGTTYLVDNVLNKLTLNYISNVFHSFIHSIDLTIQNILYNVISAINSYIPPGSGAAFFVSSLDWINGFDPSALLLSATNVPITPVNVLMRGTQEYPLMIGTNSIRIEDLVSEINLTTYATGFSATNLQSSAYIGYQGLPANLLIPVSGEISFTEPLNFDFRNIIAAYLLNMSHTTRSLVPGVIASAGEPCTCTLSSDGTITFEKVVSSLTNSNFIGNSYSYNVSNKDIAGFISSAMNLNGYLEAQSSQYPNFSYAIGQGILSMDVAIIPVAGISYGKLRLRDKSVAMPAVANVPSISLAINDPEVLNTHVYFGFLGDIRFYQISDYNLWKQYILVKRRVGLPWNKTDDAFVPDYYVSNDTYNFSSYTYTLNLVQNGKFLDYLKHVRFGQLANSLKLEDLYNNKYFWLYLKFHKEIGCDQKVIALTKKTKEDDQKAKLLT